MQWNIELPWRVRGLNLFIGRPTPSTREIDDFSEGFPKTEIPEIHDPIYGFDAEDLFMLYSPEN